MRKINLARALKEKKRIIARINEIVEWMRTENVHFKDETPNVDLREKYEKLREYKHQLIERKEKIAKANAQSGIALEVYNMEELKAELAIWNRMNTDVTPDRERDYETKEVIIREKVAFYSFQEVEDKKRELRELIEAAQDRIDELNATTFIELDF